MGNSNCANCVNQNRGYCNIICGEVEEDEICADWRCDDGY